MRRKAIAEQLKIFAGRLSGWDWGSLPHPEAVFHSPGKSRRFRTLWQRLPAKGETETPGTDILIAKGPAWALVFAILLSAEVCSPRRYYVLRGGQIAIFTPLFAIFYKNGNSNPWFLPFRPREQPNGNFHPSFCYFLQKWQFQLWYFAISLSAAAK